MGVVDEVRGENKYQVEVRMVDDGILDEYDDVDLDEKHLNWNISA